MTSYQDIDIIHITGNQCFEFINNQTLSQTLPTETRQCQYTAICSPKGRILYTLFIVTDSEQLWLAVDQSLSESLVQYLNMRRFRMDVAVTPEADWSLVNTGQTMDTTVNQYPLDTAQTGQQDSMWPTLFEWGLPWITAAHQDEHIPQHVNLDQNHIIDFKKGCFPGQEIVARLHYLGQVKKRMRLIEVTADDHSKPVEDAFSKIEWCGPAIEIKGQWLRQGVVANTTTEG